MEIPNDVVEANGNGVEMVDLILSRLIFATFQ